MMNRVLFLLLLAACTPVANPRATRNPTVVPTPTSTPVPPLVAHEWSQSESLLIFARSRGGLPPGFWGSYPVDFTLLPNGELYLLKKNGDLGYVILATTLSRQATCYLLNSIDQAGFFDYDPLSYYMEDGRYNPMPGGVTDMGGTCISVQAWRTNSVGLYAFTGSLQAQAEDQLKGTPPPGFPVILPAIRDTYTLLDDYVVSPDTLHLLKPERLGVWLFGAGEPAGTRDPIEWPLSTHALAAQQSAQWGGPTGGPPAMILTGEDGARVFDALGETLYVNGTLVREGDKLYWVFARPLLPNEYEWLGIWLQKPLMPPATADYVEWPLGRPTLAGRAEAYPGYPPAIVLGGADAAQVYNVLGQGGDTLVREGDTLYQVEARPLLPTELVWASRPEASLSCSPSDGWMQAP